jgi:hypothetical protein
MITLKNINEASLQSIFDQAANHLLAQNKRSSEEFGPACLYRSSDGLKCAVGCFISDDEYKPDMEGHCVDKILTDCDITLYGDKILLLRKLQDLHDNAYVYEWESELEGLAQEYKLTFTKP